MFKSIQFFFLLTLGFFSALKSNESFLFPNNFLIQLNGYLFETVQLSKIFPDSKTFVDCYPKHDIQEILLNFKSLSILNNETLKEFVLQNFNFPQSLKSSNDNINISSIENYIESLWNVLKKEPEQKTYGDSLITLPYSYFVQGGRFRESFYWDTYFICLGLSESSIEDKYKLIENQVKNFIYLQDILGLIPNGNRFYLATRSQPPVFGLIIDLLYEKFGINHIEPYLSALEKEYENWNSGNKKVILPDGSFLSRYYDKEDYPRAEAYLEDLNLSINLNKNEAKKLFRNLRTGAETGWDFSSRWLKDSNNLATIQTTFIVPIDLNALLYGMEMLLSKYYNEISKIHKNDEKIKEAFQKAFLYHKLAEKRKTAINNYCWDKEKKFYFDYNIETNTKSKIYSAAGCLPMFVNMANAKQAENITDILMNKLLAKGGILTSLVNSKLQWDFPNGWAPIQWFAVKGLLNYNKKIEAVQIMTRWITMIRDDFEKKHFLLEKYNVINPNAPPVDGEYPLQDGFGWTNGVTFKFIKILQNI